MNRDRKIMAAKRLLALAKELTAEEEEGDEQDEAFASRIRNIRTRMNKLSQKKRRKLNQYGVGIIRPNSTVEDLVGALEKVLAEA